MTVNTTLIIFYGMAALVALLTGFAKGGLGGTLGALATPLMALVMPADKVIGLILPMLMIADVFAVYTYWKKWDWKIFWLLIPGAIAGVTIAMFFITNAPTHALRVAMGVIVLLFAFYKIFESKILNTRTIEARDWHGIAAGTIAGFSSALAHTGGPPISIYLLQRRVKISTFNATTALFFTVLNWIKLPYYYYAGLFDLQQLIDILWILPLLPIGVWAGKKLSERISHVTFERVIVFFLVITALLLIFE